MVKLKRLFLFPISLVIAMMVGCSEPVETVNITVTNRHFQPVVGAVLELNGAEATTNYKGVATFNTHGTGGTIKAKTLPAGYSMEPGFSVNAFGDYSLTLDSFLIQGLAIERGTTIGIGDIAYDYTFTAVDYERDGKTIKATEVSLGEKLKTNDCLILNFFYVGCSSCVAEAPCISKAYNDHKEQGAYMIGLDKVDAMDDESVIIEEKKKLDLTFDVAFDPLNMTGGYGVRGMPTTVIIDRYGFICFYYETSILDSREFSDVIASFIGEDYTPKTYKQNSFELQTQQAH